MDVCRYVEYITTTVLLTPTFLPFLQIPLQILQPLRGKLRLVLTRDRLTNQPITLVTAPGKLAIGVPPGVGARPRADPGA